MREIKIEKITLNIGSGGPGDKLEKALKLLKKVSDMTLDFINKAVLQGQTVATIDSNVSGSIFTAP